MDLSEAMDLNRDELLTVLSVMVGWMSMHNPEEMQKAYDSGLCEMKRERESDHAD